MMRRAAPATKEYGLMRRLEKIQSFCGDGKIAQGAVS
jgi:hypothetical protein